MKKTIAILLVLIIGMFGIFAASSTPEGTQISIDALTGVAVSDATIDIKVNIAGEIYFGVTAGNFEDDSAFASIEAFKGKVHENVSWTGHTMADFVESETVGYLHGINNTFNDVKFKIDVGNFELANATALALELDGLSERLLEKSDGTIGTLKNSEIKVKLSTPSQVDTAPAGDWEATITISVISEG